MHFPSTPPPSQPHIRAAAVCPHAPTAAAAVGTWVTGRSAKDRRQIHHAASLPALLKILSLEPDICAVSDICNGQSFCAGEHLITEYMPPPADKRTCAERLNTLIMYRVDDPAVWLGFKSAAHAAAAIGVETVEVASVLHRTSPHVQGWGISQKIVAMYS